jgi:hypothetical protein
MRNRYRYLTAVFFGKKNLVWAIHLVRIRDIASLYIRIVKLIDLVEPYHFKYLILKQMCVRDFSVEYHNNLKTIYDSLLKIKTNKMGTKPTYILQKDLPDYKAGQEFVFTGKFYAATVVDELGELGKWPVRLVENNPTWFIEKKEEYIEVKITDFINGELDIKNATLIKLPSTEKETVITTLEMHSKGFIKKESPKYNEAVNPKKEEKITVKNFGKYGYFPDNPSEGQWYQFHLSKKITDENYSKIIAAIESVINGEEETVKIADLKQNGADLFDKERIEKRIEELNNVTIKAYNRMNWLLFLIEDLTRENLIDIFSEATRIASRLDHGYSREQCIDAITFYIAQVLPKENYLTKK